MLLVHLRRTDTPPLVVHSSLPIMRMSINKAFQFTQSGPLSKSLELTEHAIPEPKPDEVVVKICAAALNPVDVQLYVCRLHLRR